jgi:hypothetical protein
MRWRQHVLWICINLDPGDKRAEQHDDKGDSRINQLRSPRSKADNPTFHRTLSFGRVAPTTTVFAMSVRPYVRHQRSAGNIFQLPKLVKTNL